MSDYSLEERKKFKAAGYAGMLPHIGMIVDRRDYPQAIPVQANKMLGFAPPEPLYICSTCGSPDVETRVWIKMNEPDDKPVQGGGNSDIWMEETFCNKCGTQREVELEDYDDNILDGNEDIRT